MHDRTENRDLNRYLYINVYSSIVQNSQKEEANQVSINRWVDKQNGTCTYNEILSSLKNKWSFDTCYHMDEHENMTFSETVEAQKDKYCMILLIRVTQNRKIHKDGSRTEVTRSWGE